MQGTILYALYFLPLTYLTSCALVPFFLLLYPLSSKSFLCIVSHLKMFANPKPAIMTTPMPRRPRPEMMIACELSILLVKFVSLPSSSVVGIICLTCAMTKKATISITAIATAPTAIPIKANQITTV